MKLWICAASALALASCSPASTNTATPFSSAVDTSEEATAVSVHACPDTPAEGFHARECTIQGNGTVFEVKYADEPADARGGQVTVEVRGRNGATAQTLIETNVSGYFTPTVTDVDGDGAEDVLIVRDGGMANENQAFWRNVNGHYVRLGEISGTEFKHTADGYLAVPANDGAATVDVAFYRVGNAALTPLATVEVHAEGDAQGHVTHTTCTLSRAQGLASLHLTRDAARAKFCADPVAAGAFQ